MLVDLPSPCTARELAEVCHRCHTHIPWDGDRPICCQAKWKRNCRATRSGLMGSTHIVAGFGIALVWLPSPFDAWSLPCILEQNQVPFQCHLDLHGVPRRSFFELLLQFCDDEASRTAAHLEASCSATVPRAAVSAVLWLEDIYVHHPLERQLLGPCLVPQSCCHSCWSVPPASPRLFRAPHPIVGFERLRTTGKITPSAWSIVHKYAFKHVCSGRITPSA